MADATAVLQDQRCQVLENRAVGQDLWIVTFRPERGFACRAGQFVMVDLDDPRFFFRRPFSVLSVDADGAFSILYKVVGTGTRMMSAWRPGDETLVLGPLGNAFAVPDTPNRPVLLIGGGIGIAPLYCLAGERPSAQYHCFYGARSQADLGIAEALSQRVSHLTISTDDGSWGEAGTVCDALARRPELLASAGHALVCGPTAMMRAVVSLLASQRPDLSIQVSLEEHMPCGTGACSGCAVFRHDQALPSKICVEGPVFDGRVIAWPGAGSEKAKMAGAGRCR